MGSAPDARLICALRPMPDSSARFARCATHLRDRCPATPLANGPLAGIPAGTGTGAPVAACDRLLVRTSDGEDPDRDRANRTEGGEHRQEAIGPRSLHAELLQRAHADSRILVTIDTDFGQLVYREGKEHSGLLRLRDVRAAERIQLIATPLEDHAAAIESGAVVTITGDRVRISSSRS